MSTTVPANEGAGAYHHNNNLQNDNLANNNLHNNNLHNNNLEKGMAPNNTNTFANPGVGNVHGVGRRRIGNPAPLGLLSFASTLLLFSFINVRARGVSQVNAAVGMAYAVGGLTVFLAGMWEFAAGNTFGATAFSSYGGFWISLGIFFTSGFGITSAVSGNEFDALTLYFSVWFIFTFIMFIASLRSNFGLVAFFFCLDMSFLLLTVGNALPNKAGLVRAGGAFGIAAAFIAYYVGTSELCPRGASYFTLPTGPLHRRNV